MRTGLRTMVPDYETAKKKDISSSLACFIRECCQILQRLFAFSILINDIALHNMPLQLKTDILTDETPVLLSTYSDSDIIHVVKLYGTDCRS